LASIEFAGNKIDSPPFCSEEPSVAVEVADPGRPFDEIIQETIMAGRPVDPLRTRAALREEAQRFLDVAIRSQAPETRKHLLPSSFELIQRAEMMSEPPEAPSVDLPSAYLD
jgi:hypothetical protein